MKKLIVPLILGIFLVGCSSAPVAMKSNNKYFAPIKTFAQKPASLNSNKLTSASAAKVLSEQETMIQLLRKENQQLRDRVTKLEKKLSIILS